MNQESIQLIVGEVVHQLSEKSIYQKPIPIAVSARHCHLSVADLESLFGQGYQLTKKADLYQPSQFSANEKVSIVGPRGSLENVRVLGPTRPVTQVEVSKTDAIKLGLNPPLRESGNVKNSSPMTIVGPKGSIYVNEGLILAQAHIHMPIEDANDFNIKNGDFVRVTTRTERPVTFEKVCVRISADFKLEMHIDTDEANTSLISTGQLGRLTKGVGSR